MSDMLIPMLDFHDAIYRILVVVPSPSLHLRPPRLMSPPPLSSPHVPGTPTSAPRPGMGVPFSAVGASQRTRRDKLAPISPSPNPNVSPMFHPHTAAFPATSPTPTPTSPTAPVARGPTRTRSMGSRAPSGHAAKPARQAGAAPLYGPKEPVPLNPSEATKSLFSLNILKTPGAPKEESIAEKMARPRQARDVTRGAAPRPRRTAAELERERRRQESKMAQEMSEFDRAAAVLQARLAGEGK